LSSWISTRAPSIGAPLLRSVVFVYRPEVGALEAMSVVHEPRIWVATERLGESEQAATTED
jgi:hypothetical protein